MIHLHCWRTIKFTGVVLMIAFSLCLPGPHEARAQATRVYGPEDADVPLPSSGATTGTSGQAAQGLLQAYLQAAGADQWQGFQATGTITYVGNEAPPQGSATLTITRDGFTRLDVTSSRGDTSLRIRGSGGAFQDLAGERHRLPPLNARVGLFAYPFMLSPRLTEQQGLTFAAGTQQLGGRSFNRLSIARPVTERQASSRVHEDVVVTDIYFSPDTHLPYKSVDLVGAPDLSLQRYVRVITYEDYREVKGVELPFRYTETVNGQRSWVLQLTMAQSQPESDPAYFSF